MKAPRKRDIIAQNHNLDIIRHGIKRRIKRLDASLDIIARETAALQQLKNEMAELLARKPGGKTDAA